MGNIWNKKSLMQQEMVKGARGESFAVQELYRKGSLTPSQLASAMKATAGRVSTLLAGLEKKGQIAREPDPDDRRIVHVSLTQTGKERAEKQRDDMRDAVCWIFSQMGERRARIRGTQQGVHHVHNLVHARQAASDPRRGRQGILRKHTGSCIILHAARNLQCKQLRFDNRKSANRINQANKT